jgi:hypothetical protein
MLRSVVLVGGGLFDRGRILHLLSVVSDLEYPGPTVAWARGMNTSRALTPEPA